MQCQETPQREDQTDEERLKQLSVQQTSVASELQDLKNSKKSGQTVLQEYFLRDFELI